MYHVNGREPLPWELVAVRADLDQIGGQPEQVHHTLTRGAHPELKYDLTNLVGISALAHNLNHLQDAEIGQFRPEHQL